jgi:hypothetical protein
MEKEGSLHLCTDEKVWAVKQVSTSNSVHVVQYIPGEAFRNGGDDEDVLMRGTSEREKLSTGNKGGITAIAQVKNILELIDVKPTAQDVENALRDIIPVWTEFDDDDNDVYHQDSKTPTPQTLPRISLQKIYDNNHYPKNHVTKALKNLFVFGFSFPESSPLKSPALFIPTISVLLDSWRAFADETEFRVFRPDASGGIFVNDLERAFHEMHESAEDDNMAEKVINIVMAILRHVEIPAPVSTTQDNSVGEDEDYDEDFHIQTRALSRDNDRSQPFLLNREKIFLSAQGLRGLLGTWLLQSLLQPSEDSNTQKVLDVEKFMDSWKDLLPKLWAKDCDVDGLLAGTCGWVTGSDGLGKNIIRPTQTRGAAVGTAAVVIDEKPSTAAKTIGKPGTADSKKRKWHEKFGAQRNAAVKK